MATKETKKADLEHELENVQEALNKSEQFIEKNQKPMLIGLAVIVIVVVGFFGLKYGYLIPKEKKAEAAMFAAEQAFINKNFQVALDGDGMNLGLIAITSEYRWTKTANLANAYAGLSLMQLKKYEEAIGYLENFDADDILISPAIIGAIGDCYVELNQNDKAVKFFKNAAKEADNELLSPIYLMKAARVYETLNQYGEALDCYETIKKKYYLSQESADIDRFIDRAKAMKK